MENKICCLCGSKIEGWGNNAMPLKNGRCCDVCNMKVIDVRLKILGVKKEGTK